MSIIQSEVLVFVKFNSSVKKYTDNFKRELKFTVLRVWINLHELSFLSTHTRIIYNEIVFLHFRIITYFTANQAVNASYRIKRFK